VELKAASGRLSTKGHASASSMLVPLVRLRVPGNNVPYTLASTFSYALLTFRNVRVSQIHGSQIYSLALSSHRGIVVVRLIFATLYMYSEPYSRARVILHYALPDINIHLSLLIDLNKTILATFCGLR
jgi:hypothetical protein